MSGNPLREEQTKDPGFKRIRAPLVPGPLAAAILVFVSTSRGGNRLMCGGDDTPALHLEQHATHQGSAIYMPD
jgi:hypothetical protein